jgi:hypothetical protein
MLQLYLDLSSDIPLPQGTIPYKGFAFIPVEGMILIHVEKSCSSILISAVSCVCADVQPVTAMSHIQENTGDAFSLDQAHAWLNTCLEQHEHCKAYSRILDSEQAPSHRFRPTRLVEIRPDAIRLHLTSNIHYRYAALSHRWPETKGKLLTLTAYNQINLLRSIPQSSSDGFSQVFADAVRVCRRLNIGYLWIDSLCIIQSGDGGADWRNESKMMGNVYQHAVCTIAAESIEKPDEALREGMFRNRDKTQLDPMVGDATFDLSASLWGTPIIYMVDRMRRKRPKPGRYYFMSTNDWHADISMAPLSRRGWVEQERILAPRILHFTSNQIYFDCYQTMSNEIWPQGHPTWQRLWDIRPWTILQDLALHKAKVLQANDLTPHMKWAVEDPLASWYRMAYNYARTEFTISTDKLVAISGLARGLLPYIRATPSDYLAGVWVQSLPYGLLWYAPWVGRSNKRVRSSKYQAPSWSWASINYGLTTDAKYHSQPHRVLVGVESFNMITDSDNFGEVKTGSCLVLKGFTYKISLSWSKARTNYSSASKYWPNVRLGVSAFANSDGHIVCPDELYMEGVTKDHNNLRLLPILQSEAGDKYKWVQALILEPTGRSGEYQRFGYMNIAGDGGKWWFQLNTSNVLGATMTERKEDIITIV